MKDELLVIALGGNAIKQAEQAGTTEEQFANVDITAKQIAQLKKIGYRLVITHGNGPQAGALLIQQEEGNGQVPAQTLSVCGAMTQGQIGWMIQNRLGYYLNRNGSAAQCCSIITQVQVSADDPDFQDPSKPVGPFYTETEAERLRAQKGYILREAKPGTEKPWRRVVPSPKPIDVLEKNVIRTMLEQDIIVIASGGGGIPVVQTNDADYNGIDAVIDKDRAGVKLAQVVEADTFLILTDVEKVYLNFKKPEQKALDRISITEGEAYLEAGQFTRGSMAPKVEACLEFVKSGGKHAIITSLDKALDALEGKTGTHFYS